MKRIENISLHDYALATEAQRFTTAEEFAQSKINAYHGTPSHFNSFKLHTRRNTSNETNSLGIWLTNDKKAAEEFSKKFEDNLFFGVTSHDVGGTVVEAWLHLKNPKIYLPIPGDISHEPELNRIESEIQKQLIHTAAAPEPERRLIYANIEALRKERKLLRAKVAGRDSFELMMDDRDEYAEYIGNVKGVRGYWQERMMQVNKEEANEQFVHVLSLAGYDGIVLKNTRYDAKETAAGTIDQYVVFSPDQVLTKAQLIDFYIACKDRDFSEIQRMRSQIQEKGKNEIEWELER